MMRFNKNEKNITIIKIAKRISSFLMPKVCAKRMMKVSRIVMTTPTHRGISKESATRWMILRLLEYQLR